MLRGSDGGHNLPNQMIEIGIYGPFGIQVVLTYVIYGFLPDHEGTVRIMQGQDGWSGRNYRAPP